MSKIPIYSAALVMGFGLLLGYPGAAQENPVTAIDIALEPDATMIQHAEAANALLRKVFPTGYTLDATHRPHITMLQQFVRTADLDKVYAAVGDVLAGEKPAGWTLEAFSSANRMSAKCQKLKLIGKDPPTPPEYGMV